MFSIKHFISGFGLSLFAISIIADKSNTPSTQITQEAQSIPHIYLYKSAFQNMEHPKINTSVQKIASLNNNIQITAQNAEEHQIFTINNDSIIPIDFNETLENNQKTLITLTDTQEITASLPIKDTSAVKTHTYPKNNIELKNNKLNMSLSEDRIIDDSISYKVAERIKDSVLFPLSKEILNDENLTPTFIKNSKKTNKTKQPTAPKKEIEKVEKKQEKPLLTSKPTNDTEAPSKTTTNKPEKKENFLSSISSIFSPKEETINVQKNTPKYSSQNETPTATQKPQTLDNTKNKQISSLYEAIKETQHIEKLKNIQPTELNLHFTPDVAEISGKTLKWLKSFKEQAQKNNKKIQLILSDHSTRDIQVKRFNLLHDLLTNSNTKPIAIDVWLADIDADAFIIRLTNINQE